MTYQSKTPSPERIRDSIPPRPTPVEVQPPGGGTKK